MKEIYNGYELQTEWDDVALGFGFSVHDKNGAEVSPASTHIFMKRTH